MDNTTQAFAHFTDPCEDTIFFIFAQDNSNIWALFLEITTTYLI